MTEHPPCECSHDWEIHYVDFGGNTGCHEADGCDGEQCTCLGYGIGREKYEPPHPYDPSKPLSITNMPSFLTGVWSDVIMNMMAVDRRQHELLNARFEFERSVTPRPDKKQ